MRRGDADATGLTALPSKDFAVVVAPIKIAGGSGGPARVFALVKKARPRPVSSAV